jgi:hypothetical protein
VLPQGVLQDILALGRQSQIVIRSNGAKQDLYLRIRNTVCAGNQSSIRRLDRPADPTERVQRLLDNDIRGKAILSANLVPLRHGKALNTQARILKPACSLHLGNARSAISKSLLHKRVLPGCQRNGIYETIGDTLGNEYLFRTGLGILIDRAVNRWVLISPRRRWEDKSSKAYGRGQDKSATHLIKFQFVAQAQKRANPVS